MAMALAGTTGGVGLGLGLGLEASLAPTCSDETWTSQQRRSGRRAGISGGGFGNSGRWSNKGMNFLSRRVESRPVAMATFFDPHSFAFLADLLDPQLDPSKFAVNLDITNAIVDERSNWALSDEAMRDFYMAFALVFCWGCCVFGSMNDKFYESDLYRNAGGNGTGHWIYDQEAREEAAARNEMWSEDLMKEIEGKAGEGLLAEEKEREKELV